MRHSFNSVKSIFAMHTSKALNLTFDDSVFRVLRDSRNPMPGACDYACPAVENNALARLVSMSKV
jgi:hypothetical protein